MNTELLIVHRELHAQSQKKNPPVVPCVVHTVFESDGDVDVIGRFLQNNSKLFASAIRDTALVQDMLAFVISSKERFQ